MKSRVTVTGFLLEDQKNHSTTPPPVQDDRLPDRETVRFARALFRRPATFTFVFLIANVLVFLLMIYQGGSLAAASDPATLAAFGAKYNSLINEGQWWRFVTPVFIHVGFIHLFFNMYGLWVLGPYVERLYGSAKFVFFWVATGVAGVAASYLTVRPVSPNDSAFARFFFRSLDGPSAGASGAIFGLIGVLFVFGIKFRHELPPGFKAAFGTGMLPTILINLAIGYFFPFIDNSAHVGGLLAGMALASIVGYKRVGPRGRVTFSWHALQIAALVLVVVSFALAAINYRQPVRTPLTVAANPLAYFQAIVIGQQAFVHIFPDGDPRLAESAIMALERVSAPDPEAGELRDQLQSLIERARQLAERRPRSPRERAAAQEDLRQAYEAWQQRFRLWAEMKGRNYGVTVEDRE